MNKSPVTPPRLSRWIWVLLAFGFVLTMLFGFRLMRSFGRVRTFRHQPGVINVDGIRPWMTVPFLSRAFNIPKDYLYQQVKVPASGSDQKSLGELNREYFPGQPEVVLQAIKEGILLYQQTPLPQMSPAP